MDIRKRAYEMYQLDWMMTHGYSLQDAFNVLREGYCDGIEEEHIDGATVRDDDFDYMEEYFNEHGFNGSVFVCEDEFYDCEYMDVEYMHYLLKSDELIKTYHFDRMKEAMEIAGWQLTEIDGERTVWQYAPVGEDNDVPFPEVENKSIESSFGLIKYSREELQEYLEDVIVTEPEKAERFNQLVFAQVENAQLQNKRKGR